MLLEKTLQVLFVYKVVICIESRVFVEVHINELQTIGENIFFIFTYVPNYLGIISVLLGIKIKFYWEQNT